MWNQTEVFKTTVQLNVTGKNVGFGLVPVCVWPPFVWLVSNDSNAFNESVLSCLNHSCFYSLCWDADKYPLAVVMRVPRWVPIPVETPSSMTLFRHKRFWHYSCHCYGHLPCCCQCRRSRNCHSSICANGRHSKQPVR